MFIWRGRLGFELAGGASISMHRVVEKTARINVGIWDLWRTKLPEFTRGQQRRPTALEVNKRKRNKT
jgi:hypothetical protein